MTHPGGFVVGPGQPDGIEARLSGGEIVVNAGTVQRWTELLKRINGDEELDVD